ncbi:hypothetical protein [Uliginosibacterium gangwonense]|uniref:hypothetical protein n=1 Tax=Uliginosibacterium gangwonense TaxID=392736 RepID=UPI00036E8CBF|nr:hypothetical protein [Uliginosibacterium gangwonense]
MNTPEQTPLAREQFSIALESGRGAALQHALHHSIEGFEDLVLNACLNNLSFDPQCEGHRADWLYRILKQSSRYAYFSNRIVKALQIASDEHYLDQICEIAARMAGDGDVKAESALRQFVWNQNFVTEQLPDGAHAICMVDGLEAVVEIARRTGSALKSGEISSFWWSLDDLIEDAGNLDKSLMSLQELSKRDADIAAFVENVVKKIAEREMEANITLEQRNVRYQEYRERFLRECTVEKVLSSAGSAEQTKWFYNKFGRYAEDKDLELILKRLEDEVDLEISLRLMWVFRKANPSYIPGRVWLLAQHPDKRLQCAATELLANFCDAEVGALGRAQLKDSKSLADNPALIKLFIKNYQLGDENLMISALLDACVDEDIAHQLALCALDVCESNRSTNLQVIANWIYQTCPCTICRRGAVAWLIKTGSIQPHVLDEYQYDADDDAAELVREARELNA